MYHRASFGIRLGAFAIDIVLYTLLVFFLGFIAAALMDYTLYFREVLAFTSDWSWNILGFILFWVYFVYIPYKTEGQTYGKKLLGIRIHRPNEEPLTQWRLFFREFIGKWISSLILFIGFLMALGKKRLALHDTLFKTEVIRNEYP